MDTDVAYFDPAATPIIFSLTATKAVVSRRLSSVTMLPDKLEFGDDFN